NIRLLMTLSNLSHLRAETIPHLISSFESAFSVQLSDETKTLRDVLGQIDARLFQAYVTPTVDKLSILIHDGLHAASWAPSTSPAADPLGAWRPTNAKPYIYDVLLLLVLVHAEVTATALPLTNQILSYLLEQTSQLLLTAFSTAYTHYPLPALMQATLDVEFLAQTLNQFTTERAGELQGRIYVELDARTDDGARGQLQGELPGMRGVLKGLREGGRGVFGCFRREKRGRDGREGAKGAGAVGGSTGGLKAQ
ncbi:Exocyst complex component S5, partial [Teratosphaeriaceae sp. CCFEE 6253]